MSRIDRDARYYQKHRERVRKATHDYYWSHREIVCARHNKENARIKKLVLTHYSNEECKCVVCGFSDIDCLTIDHIKDDGWKHRHSIGSLAGSAFYKWLYDNDLPEGFQTLCSNCNLKKEIERRRKIRRGK